jgi:hypothetical protein
VIILRIRQVENARLTFTSHYTPTKAGILSLMQSCAVALGKYGIRANAVLPGTIATDINKEDLADTAKRDYMVKRTALGRLGGNCDFAPSSPSAEECLPVPEDIAGPVVFLASDLARYVTGASLLVDGKSYSSSFIHAVNTPHRRALCQLAVNMLLLERWFQGDPSNNNWLGGHQDSYPTRRCRSRGVLPCV